jgi:hypothetical protein
MRFLFALLLPGPYQVPPSLPNNLRPAPPYCWLDSPLINPRKKNLGNYHLEIGINLFGSTDTMT